MLSKTILYLLNATLLLLSSYAWSEEVLLKGDAIEVEDGDTLLVTFEDGVKRIQLIDIDAPEDKENPKFKVDQKRTGLDHDTLLSIGIIATNHLRKLLAGEDGFRLHYQPDNLDRYGRIPGELKREDGTSLNRQMVMNGYAIAKPSESSSTAHSYHALQQQARRDRKGLWGLLPQATQLWSGTTLNR